MTANDRLFGKLTVTSALVALMSASPFTSARAQGPCTFPKHPKSTYIGITLLGLDGTSGNPLAGTAFGDLDGDGRTDAVIAGIADSIPADAPLNIMVLKQNKNGAMSNWSDFGGGDLQIAGTSGQQGGIQIADFNGDGRNDIGLPGTTDGGGIIYVPSTFYMSNKHGGWNKVVYNQGSVATSSAVADVNGDGLPDLITVGNAGPLYATVDQGWNMNENFLSKSGHNPVGTWDVPGVTSGPSAYYVGWLEGQSIAVGDLDGDGKPDFVAGDMIDPTSSDPNQTADVYVFSEVGAQNGVPTTPVAHIVPYLETHHKGLQPYDGSYSSETRIQLADFNGDGKPDIVVFASNWIPGSGFHRVSLRVYENMGNFKFQDVTDEWLPDFNPQWGPGSDFQILDLDGNGAPDILYSGFLTPGQDPKMVDNGNGIFLNDGTGHMQLVMHDEFKAWSKQFATDHGIVVGGTSSFYPYRTADGKTNFLVLNPGANAEDGSPSGIGLGSLLTSIDFAAACQRPRLPGELAFRHGTSAIP